MNDNDYWTKFLQTGNIYDYLNYTVCTSEESFGGQEIKEGGFNGNTDKGSGDGTGSYARWRL